MASKYAGAGPLSLLHLTASAAKKSSYHMSFLQKHMYFYKTDCQLSTHTCTIDWTSQGLLVTPHGQGVASPFTRSVKQWYSVANSCCPSQVSSLYIPAWCFIEHLLMLVLLTIVAHKAPDCSSDREAVSNLGHLQQKHRVCSTGWSCQAEGFQMARGQRPRNACFSSSSTKWTSIV